MLAGYMPFRDPDPADKRGRTVAEQIILGAFEFKPDMPWRNISSEAKNLIKAMLTVDPSQRITVGDALAHPWFSKDEITRTRAEAEMICKHKGMHPRHVAGTSVLDVSDTTVGAGELEDEVDASGQELFAAPAKRPRHD